MKSSDILTTTQKRTKILLERLIGADDFEADIEQCRNDQSNIYKLLGHVQAILKKYKLPDNALPFIGAYIDGNADFSLISPAAYIIDEDGYRSISSLSFEKAAHLYAKELDEYRREFINLAVSPRATQAEIKEFLSLNWELIKREQLRLLGEEQGRIKARPQQARDRKIEELHKAGKSIVQIQKILKEDDSIATGYDASDVRKIVSKLEKRNASERSI